MALASPTCYSTTCTVADISECVRIALNCRLVRLHKDDGGQGLVEYCLILALVAFAAAAGMNSLASGLNSAFNAIGSIISAYIT